MYICINGKNKTNKYESIDLNGIYCRDSCPVPGLTCTKEIGVTRLWSDTTTWGSSLLPTRKLPNET